MGICDDCGANVALIVTWDAASNGSTVGGKNSVTTSVAPNQTAVAPGYTPVKVGHTFSGWYTEKTGGALYNTVTITAARTFYAQFTPAEYQITWDLGTGKTETTNQTYGEKLNLPTEPTRRGYAFLGWFTQETGGTQVDGNTVFKEVASTTYYALTSSTMSSMALRARSGSPLAIASATASCASSASGFGDVYKRQALCCMARRTIRKTCLKPTNGIRKTLLALRHDWLKTICLALSRAW